MKNSRNSIQSIFICAFIAPTIFYNASAFTNNYFSKNGKSLSFKKTEFKPSLYTQLSPIQSKSLLHMSNEEFSREIQLRVEAESPFRKVRFFLYALLLLGAFTSLAISGASVAAGMAGINTDLMDQSVTNVELDGAGIIILGLLYKRDLDAQNSKLKRAAKGAELAKLTVRGSTVLLDTDKPGAKSAVIPLSSFRRGRGIEKRVVITAGGKEIIEETLEQAKIYSDSLIANDLVIVPVVLNTGTGPLGLDKDLIENDYLALPAGGNWQSVIADEAALAEEQGIDVSKEGICIILKKNGRVGQRTKGIYLDKMVGEVTQRREMGFDVKNI